ncbi:MAG: DUF3068 domain-containing protein [bacterium]
MKRLGVYVLLALGAFLLVLALAVKFAVAPRAVTAPLQIPSKYRTLNAGGDGFHVLNGQTGAEDTVTIHVIRTIAGVTEDSAVAKGGGGDVAVYAETLCLMKDPNKTNVPCDTSPDLVTVTTDQVAFNRKTGLAIAPDKAKKYGAAVDGDPSIEHSGLAYKFPIDTKKKTYPFFDTVVGKAFPMDYKGTEKLQRLTVYKFVQTITDQDVYTNRVLPSTYSNVREVWVEPTTGVIVKGSENITQTLTGRASLDPNSDLRDPTLAGKVALKGQLTFDENTQRNQAQLATDNLPKIKLVRYWLPLVAGLLGLLALAVALLLLRQRSEGGGQHSADNVAPTPRHQGPVEQVPGPADSPETEPASADEPTAVDRRAGEVRAPQG